MTRIGLFGGTFDPIHTGHLDVARATREALRLDGVIVVPANVPPHRGSPYASAAHRFAMAAIALRNFPELLLSDLEMASDDPSYTTTTLDRLAARGIDTRRLFVITGADAFRDISSWRNYPALLDRCHFAVVSRPGHSVLALRDVLPDLSGRMIEAAAERASHLNEPRIILVDVPTPAISSTEIRRRIAEARPVQGLVPDDVLTYIARHKLYADSGRDLWQTPRSD